MKKPAIDPTAALPQTLNSIKENINIITGQVGGTIAAPKLIVVPYPSTGIDVAAATGTKVTKTSEFDLLVQKVADLTAVVTALVGRLNTP